MPNFNWVSGPSSSYNGDPNTTLTVTASGIGSVDLTQGITATPGPIFNALVMGTKTSGITDIATINYSLIFSQSVTDWKFFVIGLSNNSFLLEELGNFSVIPDTITNFNNQTWDGSTLSSTSSGSQVQFIFDEPISDFSFTYTGAGVTTDGFSFSGMSWTTVPEPSAAFLCGLCLLFALKRRRA